MPDHEPVVLQRYPLFDWKAIWENLANKFIDSFQRSLMYRFLYETLATKERLKILNIKSDEYCSSCGDIENHLHVVYFCPSVRPIWKWFQNVIEYKCQIKITNPIKTLMLDFRCKSRKERNTLSLLVVEYVYCIWNTRDDYKNPSVRLESLKCKIKYTKWLLAKIYDITNFFTCGYIKNT